MGLNFQSCCLGLLSVGLTDTTTLFCFNMSLKFMSHAETFSQTAWSVFVSLFWESSFCVDVRLWVIDAGGFLNCSALDFDRVWSSLALLNWLASKS